VFAPVFIDHKGHRILRLDYSGLSPDQLVGAMREAMRVVALQPPGSVRLLTIANALLDERSAEAIRRYARHNKPYVRASALVGPSPFQKVLLLSIKVQGRPELEAFDDEEKAKDWLVSH